MANYDDGNEGKLIAKMKENPAFPIGIAALIGVTAFGAYKYKTRGKISTSIYLMQLRVAAQGAVIGTLVCGVLHQMIMRPRKPGQL